MKVVDKQSLEADDLAALQLEMEIMRGLDHPHVVRLHDLIETRETTYLVGGASHAVAVLAVGV